MSKSQEKAVTPVDRDLLTQINQIGGLAGTDVLAVPSLRLEHTTDATGEPNELKGKFTLSRKDELGQWEKQDLGEEIVIQVLLQRYFFNLMKDKKRYGSKEFDSRDNLVQLFESVGEGDSRSSMLYAEGTPAELAKNFMVQDSKGRTRSELMMQYAIYALYNNELVKWRMNTSATFGYRTYQRQVSPFTVMTKVTRIEKKNGNVKFYAPQFNAVEKLNDFRAVLDKQKDLRMILTGGDEAMPEKESGEINAAEIV